ncbi:hypothetical protein OK074_8377 [Actinobacteria bacterium OK074]|nr:hypothetical protein OK074_8377 [Actinobacteria bacterium OK074]
MAPLSPGATALVYCERITSGRRSTIADEEPELGLAALASEPRAALSAPAEPSTSYLRRTALTELGALADAFDNEDDENDDRPHRNGSTAHAQLRVWDCLDTATLLVDGDIDWLREDSEDAGPDPADLVAVIVLARAGRAAFNGEVYDRCCAVNPLHGPATARHRVRLSAPADRPRGRLLHVCAHCRATALAQPATVHALLMTLPGPADGPDRVPYDETAGPLYAVRNGIPQLIDEVREITGAEFPSGRAAEGPVQAL